MARRLIDTLFFQSQGILGNVYYNDGGGTAPRTIDVEYRKQSDGGPSPAPNGQYSQFTGQRGGQPGVPLLNAFCEGLDAVTVNPSAFFPFATIAVQTGAAMCLAPIVVCDLAVQGSVSGVHITIAVTTSHGPWSASIDGVNFSAGRTAFEDGFGNSGTITVKDAANCQKKYEYKIADPANPKPDGELTDLFSYGAADPAASRVEVYVLRDAPYTVVAWSPTGVAIPSPLPATQRGAAAGTELPARCGGATNKTRLRFFVTLESPFLRVEATDNSPECGYVPLGPPTGDFRFDYVLGTDETVVGGDGLIQAAVLGNDGPVLFSLNNYRTPGQASGTFTGLRAGVYIVYARETRPGGRTIRQQVTLNEPPHGPRYRVPFVTSRGRRGVSTLYLRGYRGPVETLRGAKNATVIDWAAGNASAHFFDQLIGASSATLTVKALAGNDLGSLDLIDERQMRLEVVLEDNLEWVGWVLPDLYEEPLLARPYDVVIRATDGLGALKEVPWADGLGNPFEGEFTHWQILRGLLGRLSLPLPWAVLHTLYPAEVKADSKTEPLQLISQAASGFAESSGKPWTCEKVLQSLLDYHEMRLMQREGSWYFERLIELSTDQLTPRYYDGRGLPLVGPPVTLLKVVELPPRQGPRTDRYWENRQQLLSRHPAVSAASITAEPGEARNYLTDVDFPATAFDPISGQLLAWAGNLQARREPDAKDASKPASLRLLKQPNLLTTLTLDSPPVRLPAAGAALRTPLGGPAGYYAFQCVLSFSVKLATANFTPDPPVGPAAFYVGVSIDGGKTFLGRADTAPGQLAPGKVPVYELTGTGAAKVSIPFRANPVTLETGYPITLRFWGSTVDDVLISDLQLSIGTATNGSYVQESSGETKAGPRLTKRDAGLVLQLADTLNPDERVFSVLDRSVLLAATGQPLSLWREGLDRAVLAYYLIDYLVRDRLTWQQRPCWVLRGLLKGDYSPGALLVDPAFDPDVAFVNTAATWTIAAETWSVTAVQGLGYHTPLPTPTYGLLSEDGALLLSEDGAYTLVPEDAY
ncbi:MAG: hypothetical protein ACRYG7_14245 [Janthinobacterium lividum]